MNKTLYTSILCGILLLLGACKNNPNPVEIVMKSLEAHGGIEKWQHAKELTYLKTTILYDSTGAIEKKIIQTHKNTFQPDFEAKMQWQEGTVAKIVMYKDNKTNVFYNDSLQNDARLEEKYYKDIIAANYVIWQPYKLLDKEANLSYEGQDILEDGKQVEVIKATYFDEGAVKTTWWYYFDAETYRLSGNMVHHGTTYSYIKNIKYENQTGLFLNAERKSYMTDSLRNIKYLRAHYMYEVLTFD